jgi:uncharacterized protein
MTMLGVITGASAGLGEAFAARLAAEGWDLVITARRRERLEDLADTLRQSHHTRVRVLVADLTVPGQVAELEHVLGSEEVELLVNNAGFAGYAPFVDVDPQVVDDLIAVHIRATSRLTRAALAGMARRGSGAVINVASLLAFSATLPPQPLPYRATYAGAKAYLVAFTQALAGELGDSQVHVQVCCPGLIATDFHAGMDMSAIPFPVMEPSEVVDAALEGLRLGEVVCVPGLDDTGLLDHLGEAQQTLLLTAVTSKLAERYHRHG